MNSIILYISLILTLFQNTIFNLNEFCIVSKLSIVEQKISQQSDSLNHNFQDTCFIIDEENDDDEVTCIKNKLILKKSNLLSSQTSKQFFTFSTSNTFGLLLDFIAYQSASIFILYRVFRL